MINFYGLWVRLQNCDRQNFALRKTSMFLISKYILIKVQTLTGKSNNVEISQNWKKYSEIRHVTLVTGEKLAMVR